MQIKVDIDEARILREVLSGNTVKEIEANIVKEIRHRIFQKIKNSVDCMYENACTRYEEKYQDSISSHIETEFKARLAKLKIPKNLIKLFKNEKFDDLLHEKILSFVDNCLEHYTINIDVQTAKGKKSGCGLGKTALGEYESKR